MYGSCLSFDHLSFCWETAHAILCSVFKIDLEEVRS